MKRALRFAAHHTVRPLLLKWYLNRPRKRKLLGLTIRVVPGVFDPGLYYSSKLMAKFASMLVGKGDTCLDVGCGSGLIALSAAKAGAKVTAIDLNPEAVEITRLNAQENKLTMEVVQSDLFSALTGEFKWIFVNPPYFAGAPESHEDLAWYCGEDFEYFSRFFEGLLSVMKEETRVFMVLSDQVDVEKISEMALKNAYELAIASQRKFLLENNFIYEIRRVK